MPPDFPLHPSPVDHHKLSPVTCSHDWVKPPSTSFPRVHRGRGARERASLSTAELQKPRDRRSVNKGHRTRVTGGHDCESVRGPLSPGAGAGAGFHHRVLISSSGIPDGRAGATCHLVACGFPCRALNAF